MLRGAGVERYRARRRRSRSRRRSVAGAGRASGRTGRLADVRLFPRTRSTRVSQVEVSGRATSRPRSRLQNQRAARDVHYPQHRHWTCGLHRAPPIACRLAPWTVRAPRRSTSPGSSRRAATYRRLSALALSVPRPWPAPSLRCRTRCSNTCASSWLRIQRRGRTPSCHVTDGRTAYGPIARRPDNDARGGCH